MFSLTSILEETASRYSPAAAAIVQESHDLARVANGCANLCTVNGKVALAYAGQLPWHGQGVGVADAMTSADALRLASLGKWQLEKIQQYADFGDYRLPADLWGIVRTDCVPPVLLGSVGSKYEIVPNEDCFAFMDSLGSDIRYETAGALGNGSRVWMLADIPGSAFEVMPGDENRTKMLCTTSHDGSGAIQIFPTNVRVVCENTHRLALSDARRGKCVALKHTKNVSNRIESAKQTLGLIRQQSAQFAETATQLASTPMAPLPFFNGVLDSIVDVTVAGRRVTSQSIGDGSVLGAICDLTDSTAKLKAESALSRSTKRRESILADILDRYESDRCKGDSAWAAFNAVTETVDHGDVLRFKGGPQQRAENRFDSLISGRGDEIKQIALEMAASQSQSV